MVQNNNFFEIQSKQSLIKSKIFYEYFLAWISIISNRYKGKFRLFDLFCGKGKFDDGSESTPLMIIKKIIADQKFINNIEVYFNDKVKNHTKSLNKELLYLKDINKIYDKIHFSNIEIDDETINYFIPKLNDGIPSLIFFDPYGYKSLSKDLLLKMIKGWGNDCVFYFNINGFNRNLFKNNPLIQRDIRSILGYDTNDQINELRQDKYIFSRIINELKNTFYKEHKYCTGFEFKSDLNVISHYLMLISKKEIAYEAMKKIFYKHSTNKYRFEFDPFWDENQAAFDVDLDILKNRLMKAYAGSTLRFGTLVKKDSFGKDLVINNYREACIALLHEGEITTDRKPRKDSFPENIEITFK